MTRSLVLLQDLQELKCQDKEPQVLQATLDTRSFSRFYRIFEKLSAIYASLQGLQDEYLVDLIRYRTIEHKPVIAQVPIGHSIVFRPQASLEQKSRWHSHFALLDSCFFHAPVSILRVSEICICPTSQ